MKDRENHREVSVEQADEFRKKHKIALYIETSAKTGENVQTVFLLASKLLYMQNKDKIGEMVSGLMTNKFRKRRTNTANKCARSSVRKFKIKVLVAVEIFLIYHYLIFKHSN
jgi:hypothetical protein